MSRKSVSRKSSRSPVPPLENPNPDEKRLDLDKIMQINPWKDVDKYDNQEVGQIQEILVQFNNMVVEEKKNKRRSVGKSRAPALSPKAPTGNEDLEEASTTKETIKNDKKQRSKSESSSSVAIQENVTTDKTNDVRKANGKPAEQPEEHLEEKREKSSKSKNNVELTVPLDDKKNKRKSVEKRRASPSSSKVTNDVDLEVETSKNRIVRNDKSKSCINESGIDMVKNLSIEIISDNNNTEEDEDHPEEKTDKSSKSTSSVELDVQLNDKKNKRKSPSRRRASTSSSKVINYAYLEVETTKNKMIRNDTRKSCKTESSIDVVKNLSTENTSDNKNTEDDEDHPEEKTEKSSKSTSSFELDVQLNDKKNKRKSPSQRRVSTSSSKVSNDAYLEEHPEEKTEKSSKSTSSVELDVQLNDKKNKRKSPSQRRVSTSSSKVSNDAYLEEETTKSEVIRNDTRKSCITESSINMLKNLSIENTSDNKNTEEDEDHPEEKKQKSSKSTSSFQLNVQLNDKKNKRKSPSQRRVSTSSSKLINDAYLEEETTKNKMIRNDTRKSCITESSINMLKNLSTENTNDNKNTEEDEDDPEEKKEKSSKSTSSFELDVQLNDKKNKRKSPSQRRVSTSSSKATGSNADLEEKTKKKEKMRNDAIQHWISESSVNDAIINVPESVAAENSSNNQNNVTEERKVMREENKDLFSKVINRVEKRSPGKRLISSSAMKTIASNNATEGQSNLNKEKCQYWLITSDGAGSIVDPEENIGSDHKRDNISIESYKEKITTQKLEEIRGQTTSETATEKIVDVRDTFTVQLPQISGSVSPASRKDESSYVEGIKCDEPSFNEDFVVNNESIISGHLGHQNFQVFSSTNKMEMLESQSENRKNCGGHSDDYFAKQSSTMKPRAVSAEPERKTFAEYTEKQCESKNTINPESEKTNVVKKESELSVKQPSTIKTRSASAEPDYKKFAEYNNNGFQSKHARKREEKMAKAFEKFGKKFVKYSSRIEQPQNYEIGPNDTTLDSESDSYSSGSSSSSNSSSSSRSSSSSSDSDESSSSESTSYSSTCSCCSGSSSDSSYTSCSGSTCSCPSCCEDDMYSEYTLASSSSTHPGSDESTDSSMD